MDFSVTTATTAEALNGTHAALVVPVFEGELAEGAAGALDAALGGLLARLRDGGDFAGQAKELSVLYPAGGRPERVIVAGLGKRPQATLEGLRRAAGEATRRAQALRAGKVTFWAHDELLPLAGGSAERLGQALYDAAMLAAYSDEVYKSKTAEEKAKRPGPATLGAAVLAGAAAHADGFERAAREAALMEKAVRTARDLGNLPGNDGTPRKLAERAQALAAEVGLAVKVLDEAAMQALGMGALLGVAMGSAEPPRFIVLEHTPAGTETQKPIVLVGKGVTFDTGGISIKPADKMEEMKHDKCGGCAVIGAMEAVARLGIARRVIGIVPAAENMPSDRAQRPGDIRRAMDGQTIEIINTDAEGRLLLADALAYACKEYEPEAIVDLATLTGACVVALGSYYAGLFTASDALAAELVEAATRTGERLWRLPLDPDYDELIKSTYADVKNSGGRWGGAVSAARFLAKFVKEGVPWAHLDIAGTAWMTETRPYYTPGATGFGVRLLIDWLRARS